jgi:tellurite resistance protein TehA-like permease
MIHEKFSTINRLSGLQDVLNGVSADWLAWSWWIIYLPILVGLAVILLRWFVNLPIRTKLLVASAIFLAVLGQVGMEAISSFVSNSSGEYIGPVWRGLQKFIGRCGLSMFLLAIVDYIWLDPDCKKLVNK